jgi:hypothetical protein
MFTITPTRWCVCRARNAGGLPNTKKQNLIARYGADIRLCDLREEIAKCDRHGKMHDACMVRYAIRSS